MSGVLKTKENEAAAEPQVLIFDQKLLEERAYWVERLSAEIGDSNLRLDHERPAGYGGRLGRVELNLAGDLLQGLTKLTKESAFLLYVALMANLKVCLYKHTASRLLVVGSPALSEHQEASAQANALAIVDEIDAKLSFKQFLVRVRQNLLDAYARPHYPFSRLVKDLGLEGVSNKCPLFDIALVLKDIHGPLPEVRNDITFTFAKELDGVRGEIAFNPELFEEGTIRRLALHFSNTLRSALANLDAPLEEIEMLSSEERRQLIAEWSQSRRTDAPAECIHHLIEAQAARTPHALAAACDDERLTYAELDQRANRLARHLQSKGVGPEVIVGICLERSPLVLIAVLGVLKSGGAYLPLDPSYPKERLGVMLADARVSVLLTEQRVLDTLPEHQAKVVCLDAEAEKIEAHKAGPVKSEVSGRNAAYVIYTSGSTGQPKGVIIEHASLVQRIHPLVEKFDLHEGDGATQVLALGFDAMGEELYPTLTSGGFLRIIPNVLEDFAARVLFKPPPLAMKKISVSVAHMYQIVDELTALRRPLPETLRLMITGGDSPSPEYLSRLFSFVPHPCVYMNVYGPTEATILAIAFETQVAPDVFNHLRKVPIGRPLPNSEVYLLDQKQRPVPVGVPGEIYIGGPVIARGYLGRPDATAEKFIPHPFSNAPGARLYRTGDLACFLPDGQIEFIGRVDTQVKLRGFRVELGEIETVLCAHPAVREAVVLVQQNTRGDKRLVAFYVCEQGRSVLSKELQDFLAQKLPPYMVPHSFTMLEAMPLSPNGKLDRRALLALGETLPLERPSYVAPRTEVEKTLAEIWERVLEVKEIGVNDNFFQLGGHSLLATQVMSRVRDAFQKEIPLLRLFEAPTVAGLAASIEAILEDERGPHAPPLKPIERVGPLPLSFAQQRLWFLNQLDPNSSFYNLATAVRLRGQLNLRAPEEALSEIVRRHEALRTVFPMVEGQPSQLILEPEPLSVPLADLSALPARAREAAAHRLSREDALQPFDLARGPLLRVKLLRLGEDDYVALLSMHHIISDGWSLGILVQEIATLYRAAVAGQPSPLPELAIQYADYAHWQRAWLQGPVLAEQLEYWRGQLADAPPVINLPLDRPRPPIQSFRTSQIIFNIPTRLTAALKELSQREDVTLFMTLLAAFNSLLSRYTRQDRIVLGTPIANRNRSELEPLIGFFVNTLVLSTEMSGNPSVREVLQRVREVCLGAYAHQDIPFEKLVEELEVERSLSHHPLFQVMFTLQNAPKAALELPELSLSVLGNNVETARENDAGETTEALADESAQLDGAGSELSGFDLALGLEENGPILNASLFYNADLFKETTARRMVGHYLRLLEAIVADPSQRMFSLPMLTPSEEEQLAAWNEAEIADAPELPAHLLFERQAARTPDATALVFEDERLTYSELNARANRVAHSLRASGVAAGAVVGLLLERSPEMLAALLGILKAGGAYLPLDPAHPQERLAFMLKDAGARVVVAQDGLHDELLAEFDGAVLRLPLDAEHAAGLSVENPRSDVSAADLAYLIYTSGTTGKPKAVAVEHRQLSHTLRVSRERFGFNESDVMPFIAPLSFDIALFELMSMLLVGGRVLLLSQEHVLEMERLARTLEEATVFHAVPSLMRQVVAHLQSNNLASRYSQLRRIFTGGDAVPVALLSDLRDIFESAQVTVLYGPTEATIICTSYDVPRRTPLERQLIGRPFANVRLRVCDPVGQQVPVGVPGEIHIGGAGVTRGYVGREDLNAEKYVLIDGERYYRTGDLGRYMEDGTLEFLGRDDEQLKIRGFRIEPGEIEAALEEHEAVRDCVVVARTDRSGEKRLLAYVVLEDESGASAGQEELRAHLKARLPEYMIPSALLLLPELPLTANGKVDRRALPSLEAGEFARAESYVPPRDVVEMQVAQIWEELLETGRVGALNNFFELGGHSLLAVRLMARIQQQFGVQLPLSTLFQEATVAHLARLLREQERGFNWSPLVALQPKGERRPFFCVHPAGGQVFCYYQLSRLLGMDQPFYAWQAPDFTSIADGGEDNYERIEDRAAAYLAAMREVQPHGPYQLGGWSFGGTVAFEIAQQLRRAGERVSLLAQLDAIAPLIDFKLSDSLLLIGLAKEMASAAGRELSLTAADLESRDPTEQLEYVLEALLSAGIVPPDIDRESAFAWARRNMQGFRLRHQSTQLYQPQPYEGQITLFRAETNPMYLNDEAISHIAALYQDRTHGWEQLTSMPVKVVDVSGYHETMLLEPHVEVLAQKLRAAMSEAEVE